MHHLTDRIESFERSKIRVLFDLAESTPGDVVRLEVGDPDFNTPDHVTDAAHEAARSGATHYTSSAGIPELRAAISTELERHSGVLHDPDEVLVTTGGMEALHLAAVTTIDPGEELLIPSPAWPNYWSHARLADGQPVEVPMPGPSFDLDADRVIERMGPNTAAVVLCRPANPTGRVADADEVRAVVAAAADHDAYVLADEVYASLAYDRDLTGVAALTDHPDHVLTVGSCSKTYAMTGWRVGWLAGAPAVIDGARTAREATTACTASVAQHAALAALTGPREPVKAMYDAFHERRDYVVDRLDRIDGVTAPPPEGAFYAFLDPDTDEASLPLAKRLVREAGVALAPGSGFGEAGRGRLRLSFANSMERIEEGLDRLERAL